MLEASHVKLMTDHEIFLKEHEAFVKEQEREWEWQKERWRQYAVQRQEDRERDRVLDERISKLVVAIGQLIANQQK